MFLMSAHPKQCNVPYSNPRHHPFPAFKDTVRERLKEKYIWVTSYNTVSTGQNLGLMLS